MDLETRINQDLKEAMKNKEEAKLRALRAIKSALLLAKTEKGKGELNSEQEVQLLQKLLKQRKDSLDIYIKQGRQDLAKKEEDEIGVINIYLPKQLSDEELEHEIDNLISESGASEMKDMGKVMGLASKRLAGKADNKKIADLVKEKLSS